VNDLEQMHAGQVIEQGQVPAEFAVQTGGLSGLELGAGRVGEQVAKSVAQGAEGWEVLVVSEVLEVPDVTAVAESLVEHLGQKHLGSCCCSGVSAPTDSAVVF